MNLFYCSLEFSLRLSRARPLLGNCVTVRHKRSHCLPAHAMSQPNRIPSRSVSQRFRSLPLTRFACQFASRFECIWVTIATRDMMCEHCESNSAQRPEKRLLSEMRTGGPIGNGGSEIVRRPRRPVATMENENGHRRSAHNSIFSANDSRLGVVASVRASRSQSEPR